MKWLPGTASGFSLGYNSSGTRGNTLQSVLKSMIYLEGVPILAKFALVQCSRMMSLHFCNATTSCIGKPSQICETISIHGIASLVLMFWDLLESELAVCLPTSLLQLLSLWVLVMVSFLGLLASNWDAVA